MARQIGPRAFVQRIKAVLPGVSEQLPELPPRLLKLLGEAEQGRLALEWRSRELGDIHRDLQQGNRLVLAAIAAGSMLIAGALLLAFESAAHPGAGTRGLLALLLLAGGAATFARVWWKSLSR